MILTDMNGNAVGTDTNPLTITGLTAGGGGASSLIIKEAFNGTASLTKTFSQAMTGIGIANDGANDLSFTVLGITLIVKPGEAFEGFFDPFITVTFSAQGAFRAYGMRPSGASTIPVDTTPPANVSNLQAINVTSSTLTLTWDASISTDVSAYNVYIGSTLYGDTVSTAFNVTGLTGGQTYTFWVKARDGSGNEAAGSGWTQTMAAPDTTPPTEVTPQASTALTHTGVMLNWIVSAAPDIKDYLIFDGAVQLGVVGHPGTSFNVTGLTPATAYAFTIKSRDTSNNVSTGVTVNVTTAAAPADLTPPTDVIDLTAGTPTASSMPLTWTLSASGDVASYEVAYSTDNFVANSVIAAAALAPSTTAYDVTGLAASTAYTFRVVAIDTSANRSTGATVAKDTAVIVNTIASDDFSRVDGALGTSPTGQAWASGGLTIISGQVGAVTAQAGNAAWATMNTANADLVEITLDITSDASQWGSLVSGIVFRFASGAAMYGFGIGGNGTLTVYQAGGSPVPANKTGRVTNGTHTLKVKLIGQTVECYFDGVMEFTFQDTLLTANTKHGVGIYNTTIPKLDNFSVKTY